MTFSQLSKLIKKYKIPKDVKLESDSGWECGATPMNGVYYCKAINTIVFTQYIDEYDGYYDDVNWLTLTHQNKDKGETK